MLGASTLGLAVVAGILLAAWLRRRSPGPGEKAGMAVVIGLGFALPVIVIAALFVVSDIFVIGETQAPAASATKLTVHVVGHDWFWEVRYPGSAAVTANEIHIPARTAVLLEATTFDVIHSFWVPQLNRKIDTIPGRTNEIELYADRPGTYRGQCAEFCGLQHAHMAMVVVADPLERFRAWLAAEARPARAPATALERRGEQVFLNGPCASCHTIRGTSAAGFVGPDLTHVAERSTLGALTIRNDPADLAAWIVDSQHVKPGNQMPDVNLTGPQLRALVAYLDALR
jgi:cytochrome c oxidase subunit 2